MRVVVDTNVILSGLMNQNGYPGQVVDAVLSRKVSVLYDDRILGEYREVLRRPKFRLVTADIEAFVQLVEKFGEYFSGQRLDVVLPDETDLPFLEVAVAGFADALITGNAKHFKPRKGRHDINVCSPAEFISRPI